jgi:transcription initiation factor IIE alpha subunit
MLSSYVCKICKEDLGEDKNIALMHVISAHKDRPEIRDIAKELDKLVKTTNDIMEK